MILKLGDERLYQISEPVTDFNTAGLAEIEEKLHEAMFDFRAKYQVGRAIAAPQIGIFMRIIYLNMGEPVLMINPELSNFSDETFELWDDCMSFPNLLVKVKRHKFCTLTYTNRKLEKITQQLTDDVSELLQHEYDHLNGILATMLAIDKFSFKWKD
ncbi:MAG TPA: formylmethionine deformylase [Bacteroidales bacterium]|nr:formylmethionine deformylase [Bacteroidales bacterium]